MNVSFSGCGFLGLYHVGVASCIKTYAPQLYLNKVAGASAGSMAALALLADLPIGEMTSQVLKLAMEARKCTFGPFSPSFNINTILSEGLQSVLPEDVHLKLNGKLHVSLTKVYDGKNLLVNQFSSKQEVIDVILASAFIPIFSGWLPPRYRGVRVIDGGYSDNSPILDQHTVTVSPFCGNSDICPQDDYILTVLQIQVAGTSIEMSKDNLIRMSRVLLPPDPEVLSRYCKQGFEDCLRFLQRSYLISCTRCLAVDSTYAVEKEAASLAAAAAAPGHGTQQLCASGDPDCLECRLQRHLAQTSSVPDNVLRVFEEAIEAAEGGALGWLKTINSFRIVRLLTYPAKIPLNVAMSLVNRLNALQPLIAEDSLMMKTVNSLIEQLYSYATNGGYLKPSHRAKYTCEFNITQYGDTCDDTPDTRTQAEVPRPPRQESVRDLLNLGFTAHMESDEPPQLPTDRASAIRFQHENMAAAVTSAVPSCAPSHQGSCLPSRVASRVTSRVVSTAATPLAGSRHGSMSSLLDLEGGGGGGGALPDTIGQIQAMTEQQEAVMSFYYTDTDNQLKLMEIFDVTAADELIGDTELGVDYSCEQVLSHTHSATDLGRAAHPSSSRHRHSSDSACIRGKSRPSPQHRRPGRPVFGVGNEDSGSDTEEEEDPFSDPEADWMTQSFQRQMNVS